MMDPLKTVFAGLLIGELLIIGIAVKAIAVTLCKKQGSTADRARALLCAPLVILIGAGAAAGTLAGVIPAQWGNGAYWFLLLAGFAVSTAAPILWVMSRHRREAPALLSNLVPVAQPNVQVPKNVKTWPHAGLAAGLETIRRKREAYARSWSIALLVIAVPVACVLGFKFGLAAIGGVALVALVAIAQCYRDVGGVCEMEYRTLPGSRDAAGKHQCVYCGKSGVYRQGAYASNSTWHQCTGCRKHLFVD